VPWGGARLALVPITPNGTVHPDALVWHLPQKYAVMRRSSLRTLALCLFRTSLRGHRVCRCRSRSCTYSTSDSHLRGNDKVRCGARRRASRARASREAVHGCAAAEDVVMVGSRLRRRGAFDCNRTLLDERERRGRVLLDTRERRGDEALHGCRALVEDAVAGVGRDGSFARAAAPRNGRVAVRKSRAGRSRGSDGRSGGTVYAISCAMS
jgi:hypothetical protein